MKILAALDGSAFGDRVLEQAIRLADKDRDELTILTVVDVPLDDPWGSGTAAGTAADLAEERYRAAGRFVDAARAKAESRGVRAEAAVELGLSPSAGIVDFAEKNGHDLIVVGHIGRTGLSRFLLGSVAARVVTHSPCSVYVVR